MDWMLKKLKIISKGNVIAEIMLIGWTFTYLLEGASGFGTPTALAAPILANSGLDPIKSVIVCLVFNTLQTPFGAVGTPIWFGLGGVLPHDDDKLKLGYQVQIILSISAYFVALSAIYTAIPDFKRIWRQKYFILISIASPVLPALLVSFFSYELPSILGGLVGLIITGLCVSYGIGFVDDGSVGIDESDAEKHIEKEPEQEVHNEQDSKEPNFTLLDVFLNTFPILCTIVILVLTRIPAIGLRRLLTLKEPFGQVDLGTLGTFRISAALVLQLNRIFGVENANWTYNTLFIPAWLPFVVVSMMTVFLHRKRMENPMGQLVKVIKTSAGRMKAPALALMGATSLVSLLTLQSIGDDTKPPSEIIGTTVANGLKHGWIAIAMIMGALGSFFSGSTTVSNLTFGSVQQTAARNIGVNELGMLTLQVVGASMGNMICIHNILSAKVVVGLDSVTEGTFIKKMIPSLIVFTIVGTTAGLLFIFQ
jgi:lactate permease